MRAKKPFYLREVEQTRNLEVVVSVCDVTKSITNEHVFSDLIVSRLLLFLHLVVAVAAFNLLL